jgi:hypothetical protein
LPRFGKKVIAMGSPENPETAQRHADGLSAHTRCAALHHVNTAQGAIPSRHDPAFGRFALLQAQSRVTRLLARVPS